MNKILQKILSSPLLYFILVILIPIFFTCIYSKNSDQFVLANPQASRLKQTALKDFFLGICNPKTPKANVTIGEDFCNFSYPRPIKHQTGLNKNLYNISGIKINYHGYKDQKITLKYLIQYQYHRLSKNEDIGFLEFDLQFLNHENDKVFLRAIPFTGLYNQPLKEITKISFDIINPEKNVEKSLDFFVLGVFTFNQEASAGYWKEVPIHSISKTGIFLKLKNFFTFGTPVFESEWDKRKYFLYFSGITFLTVGFGDMVPVTSTMQIFSVLEAALGIMMLGLLSASFFSLISPPKNSFISRFSILFLVLVIALVFFGIKNVLKNENKKTVIESDNSGGPIAKSENRVFGIQSCMCINAKNVSTNGCEEQNCKNGFDLDIGEPSEKLNSDIYLEKEEEGSEGLIKIKLIAPNGIKVLKNTFIFDVSSPNSENLQKEVTLNKRDKFFFKEKNTVFIVRSKKGRLYKLGLECNCPSSRSYPAYVKNPIGFTFLGLKFFWCEADQVGNFQY